MSSHSRYRRKHGIRLRRIDGHYIKSFERIDSLDPLLLPLQYGEAGFGCIRTALLAMLNALLENLIRRVALEQDGAHTVLCSQHLKVRTMRALQESCVDQSSKTAAHNGIGDIHKPLINPICFIG